jgi:multiple sugar transport system substrate-binding protein
MQVFVEQTTTIPKHLVETVTMPDWGKINPKLANELDLAFTSGQDAATTAKNIDRDIRSVLG